MNDAADQIIDTAGEIAHHTATAIVLLLAVPVLILVFIVALLVDIATPRRESPWDRRPKSRRCSTTAGPATESSSAPTTN